MEDICLCLVCKSLLDTIIGVRVSRKKLSLSNLDTIEFIGEFHMLHCELTNCFEVFMVCRLHEHKGRRLSRRKESTRLTHPFQGNFSILRRQRDQIVRDIFFRIFGSSQENISDCQRGLT